MTREAQQALKNSLQQRFEKAASRVDTRAQEEIARLHEKYTAQAQQAAETFLKQEKKQIKQAHTHAVASYQQRVYTELQEQKERLAKQVVMRKEQEIRTQSVDALKKLFFERINESLQAHNIDADAVKRSFDEQALVAKATTDVRSIEYGIADELQAIREQAIHIINQHIQS